MIVYRLMEFARCDGTDIPAFVRGNENGRGEGSRGEDIHDQITTRKCDDNPAAVSMENPGGVICFISKNVLRR